MYEYSMFVQKKNRDEKTFCAAGIKKDKSLVFKNASARNIFFLFFIPATQNVFSMRNFFARIDTFYMNIRNFCLNFLIF